MKKNKKLIVITENDSMTPLQKVQHIERLMRLLNHCIKLDFCKRFIGNTTKARLINSPLNPSNPFIIQ